MRQRHRLDKCITFRCIHAFIYVADKNQFSKYRKHDYRRNYDQPIANHYFTQLIQKGCAYIILRSEYITVSMHLSEMEQN